MLRIIVAVAANGVIGKDNALPWRIPDDLRRFRALTTGHPVIMGRRTYESIGRPLSGRRNIVVTGNPEWRADGVETAASLVGAVALAGGDGFVIGGASLFAEALPLAGRIELTEVGRAYDGDVRFPPFDRAAWREVAREDHPAADPPFAFVTLERREPAALPPRA